MLEDPVVEIVVIKEKSCHLRFVPERLLVGHFPPEGKQREVLKEFV
jgi:hypothetical protein